MTKNNYQQMIRTYEERKEELKRECSTSQGGWYWEHPEWKKRSAVLNNKLRTWKAAVRRYEKREEAVRKIARLVEDFFCFSISARSHKKKDINELSLAESIFYKYGMENGLRGVDLAAYRGINSNKFASNRRMKFTRSFATNPDNRDMWNRFKQYVEDVD